MSSSRRASRRFRFPALAGAVLSVSLLAAACGGSDADTASEAGADAGSGDAANGPVIDDATFSGEAATVSGGTFELGDLAGQDLVLWFWAPW
ncbi:MAG: hypothetical protein AAGA93_02895 [Actinomycetota bacterium]